MFSGPPGQLVLSSVFLTMLVALETLVTSDILLILLGHRTSAIIAVTNAVASLY
jgi:hypothetical protein